MKAYLPPVDLPVQPLNEEVQNDQQRVDREHRANENRRNFVTMGRDRLFKKAIRKFIRLKLLEETENATIQDLCTKARQKLILRELCPVYDWSRDGFNEMKKDFTEKNLNVITKMSENQNSLKTKLNALTEKFNTQRSPNSSRSNYQTKTKFKTRELEVITEVDTTPEEIIIVEIVVEDMEKNYRANNRGRYNYRRHYRGQNSSNCNSNYNNCSTYNTDSFRQNQSNDEITVNTGKYDGHIETTAFCQKICYTCGYPNHTARNCEVKEKIAQEEDKFRSTHNQKTLRATHTPARPFTLQNSDIHDSNLHSLNSANDVSVLDFDPIFTDPLTGQSLSDDTHSNALNILISADGENLMYIPLKIENGVRRKALIDTGACANAMQADFYEKLKTQCSNSVSELRQASLLNVKVASGRTVKVLAQVDVKFKLNEHQFDDIFLILPSMNSAVLGNRFFKKYNIEINSGENLLKLPNITYQLNEIEIPSQARKKILKTKYPVYLLQKFVIKPQQQEILYAKIDVPKKKEGHTGSVIPDEAFEESTELKLSPAVVKVGKDNNISIVAINLKEQNVTITKNEQIAVFQFLSPQDEQELI